MFYYPSTDFVTVTDFNNYPHTQDIKYYSENRLGHKYKYQYLYSNSAIFISESKDVFVAGGLREPAREYRRILVEVGRDRGVLQTVVRLLAVHHEPLEHVVVVQAAICNSNNK